MSEKPTTIAEYVKSFPAETEERLREMLQCLREAAPEAEENLKWNQPALSYDWILFQFAAFKNHVSLYPTPAAIRHFAKELADYETSSSTIQFPLDQPLPTSLIKKIAQYRVEEAKKGVKWM